MASNTNCIICYFVSGNSTNIEGKCLTVNNNACQFPFRYFGVLSDTCLPHPDGGFWCSINVDDGSNHLEGEDNWEFCNNFCPIFGKENVTISSKEVTSSGTSVTFQGKSEAWKGKFQKRVIPFVEKLTIFRHLFST